MRFTAKIFYSQFIAAAPSSDRWLKGEWLASTIASVLGEAA